MTKLFTTQDVRDALREQLGDKLLERAARVQALNSRYIPSDRDAELTRELDLILAHIMNKHSAEGYAVAVTGPSGSGKSTLVNRRLDAHPALKPFTQFGNEVQLCLRVQTPSSCTTLTLLTSILKASGYPIEGELKEDRLWTLVRNRMKRCMHKVIFFDEFQHVIKGPKAKGRAHLTNNIKILMQDAEWPIWIICAGMPDLLEYVDLDIWKQTDRRTRGVSFEELSNSDEDIELIENIMRDLASAAKLELVIPMTYEFLCRIIHGGVNRFGMTMQLIKSAMEVAIMDDENGSELTYQHFEQGYKRMSRCTRATNVFVNDEWHRIIRDVGRDNKLSAKAEFLE